MSRRVRLIGLAIALALLVNGVANHAFAGLGVLRPVKACAPVQQVPACQPVKPLPLPEVCQPVKPLPPPKVCAPVKACAPVDAHGKHVVHDHIAQLVWRLKRHTAGYTVYESDPQPVTSPAPSAPVPAPQPPRT
jgi:hypothetical protein